MRKWRELDCKKEDGLGRGIKTAREIRVCRDLNDRVGLIGRERVARASGIRRGKRAVTVRRVVGQRKFLAESGRKEEKLQFGKE